MAGTIDGVHLENVEVYKALGDDTRYALFVELMASPRPLSTAELAERFGLHPNTVRPHLERMREAGLLEVAVECRGTVGRPQHRYQPAPGRRPARPGCSEGPAGISEPAAPL